MKYRTVYLSIIFLVAASSRILALDVDTLWIRTYGGSFQEEGVSLRPTSDGGYIIAGNREAPYTYPWYYIVKTDSAGLPEWDASFKGEYFLSVASAVQTADGGYFIAGSESEMPFSFIHSIKTDDNGTAQWQIHHETSYTDTHCNAMIATSDGNFAMGGDTGGFSGGTGTSLAYFLMIDDTGTTVIESYVGESAMGAYLIMSSLQETSDGYVMSGRGTTYGAGATVIKLSGNGSEEWNACAGESFNDGFNCARELPDGSFLAAGYLYEEGDYDCYLSMIDSDGLILWTKEIGSPDRYEFARDFIQVQDGGFLVAAECYYAESPYYSDIYLFKTDFNGNVEWQTQIGGFGNDTPGEIIEISEDVYLLVGSTQTGSGGSDVLLLKFQVSTQGMEQSQGLTPEGFVFISCSPNPCNTSTSINYTIADHVPVSLSVYDMSGRLVRHLGTRETPGSYVINWDTTDDAGRLLSSGVYTIVANSGINTCSRRMVLIR